jgi:cytochrome c-type biogenesis protein CcmE
MIILPCLFREGQSIFAIGVFIDGNIIGLLAKHGENYMPKELADDISENMQSPIRLRSCYTKEISGIVRV